jgi:hypothetical protein
MQLKFLQAIALAVSMPLASNLDDTSSVRINLTTAESTAKIS